MIKAILFDLDETLIDRAETMRRFLVAQHRIFPGLSGCTSATFASICLSYQDNGYADKQTAYTSACMALGVKNSSLAEKLYADFKDRYGNEPVPFPDVSETLKLLRRKYRIGLVSNGRTKGQTAKINAGGISEFFSSICISESVGCKKPDAAIFQACLDELSVQPNEAVFVGDNPIVDIEPAKKLGMFTVWVKNPHFPAPVICDGIVTNICELPSVVAKLA